MAVAVTLAWPPLIVAVSAERPAEAPLAGLTVKPMTPPSTGLVNWLVLLAVTVTASGLTKSVPTAVVCGVLPVTGVRMKPWSWKAPMSTLLPRV